MILILSRKCLKLYQCSSMARVLCSATIVWTRCASSPTVITVTDVCQAINSNRLLGRRTCRGLPALVLLASLHRARGLMPNSSFPPSTAEAQSIKMFSRCSSIQTDNQKFKWVGIISRSMREGPLIGTLCRRRTFGRCSSATSKWVNGCSSHRRMKPWPTVAHRST